MKIQTPEQILKDDLAKLGDVPPWLDQMLLPLNTFILNVGQALQNGIAFVDNFFGVEVSMTLVHGVGQKYSPPKGKRVKGIQVVDTGGQILSGYGLTTYSDDSVLVTVNFAAGGTTSSKCLVQIHFR